MHCTQFAELRQDLGVIREGLESAERILDDLNAVGAGPPWRCMDTAPKDGRTILVSDGAFCSVRYWEKDEGKNGGWMPRAYAHGTAFWMPLPAMPGASCACHAHKETAAPNLLDDMTPEERADVMDKWCGYCGDPAPCHCMNDE